MAASKGARYVVTHLLNPALQSLDNNQGNIIRLWLIPCELVDLVENMLPDLTGREHAGLTYHLYETCLHR